MTELVHLELAKLKESPFNPRQFFDADALADLQDSIATQGILQPLVVRPLPPGADMFATHEIVCGHRRARAATELELDTVPCIVRHMSDLDAAIAQAHENAARADITPLEEAAMFSRLHDEHGLSVDQVAEKVAKSRSYVYGRMKLSRACEKVQEAMRRQALPAELALELARIPAQSLQEKALDRLREGDEWVSVRTARNLVRGQFFVSLKTAPWMLGDATLTERGSCHDCLRMSHNDPDTSASFNEATCLDTACFNEKFEAHYQRERLQTIADAARSGNSQADDNDQQDGDDEDDDPTTHPSHPAVAGRVAYPYAKENIDDWSPAERVAVDEARWDAVRRAAVLQVASTERTAEDLRMMLGLHLAMFDDFGYAGHCLGIHSADAELDDEAKARAWLSTADGQQMATLLVAIAVDELLGHASVPFHGRERAAKKVSQAEQFGLDVVAIADAAQASPADAPAETEAA
jgi:ParB/RepB/Spo0J family partition protein